MSKISDRLKGHRSNIGTKKDRPALNIPHPTKKIIANKHGDHLNVPISDLQADPDQPRKTFEDKPLKELSQSIKDRGLLQPILIRDIDEKFIIVAGERRFRAAKMAGLELVSCIVTTGDPSEISLIENIQRENLSPIELANALHKMMNMHKYTQKQLGEIIGKSQKTVSAILSVLKLPQPILKDITRARVNDDTLPLPRRSLVEISKASNDDEAMALYNAAKGGATSDEIRETRQAKAVDKIINKRPKLEILIDKIDLLIKAFDRIDDPQRFKVELRSHLKKLDEHLSRFK